MPTDTKKCAHPACNCPVDDKTKYCSQYCKDSAASTEISCNCGHAGCSVSEGAPTMKAQS